MKKLLLILLCLPMIVFGQDIKYFTITDLVINQVLENTSNYLEHKNDFNPNGKLEISIKNVSIDWNNIQLIKWQIIEAKDSLEIMLKFEDFKTID